MMPTAPFCRPTAIVLFLCLLCGALAGCLPGLAPTPTPTTQPPLPTFTPTAASPNPPTATPMPRPITLAVDSAVPDSFTRSLLPALLQIEQVQTADGARPLAVLDRPQQSDVQITLAALSTQAADSLRLAERYYAAVVPFATVQDGISLAELQARWQGSAPLLATGPALQELRAVLGDGGAELVAAQELAARLEARPGAVGLIGFEQLEPTLKVLAVDGQNPLDKAMEPGAYPLAVAIQVAGTTAEAVAPLLQGLIEPATNRELARMTSLIMTGVTAMSRGTAARMEAKGYTYPAEIISATLRAADITHVSNEVPFIEGCVVRNTVNNLVLCSDYPYWAALEAIGTDIVGLSGNHVNDFGRSGARESIQFYRDRGIPIYGSGLNLEEACAPLLWESNGNRFAFIAALAFWPQSAFATADQPGACYFYDNYETIVADIRRLSQEVDLVSVELQYLETYNPFPTAQQVQEFRDLRTAGATIVTGVQSHVPQSWEAYAANADRAPSIIVYGLGNLFFDQMWSWETRTQLYARHTIYAGRLISSEVLTGVLEDYAQPRWATAGERAEILQRIFGAAPARN